MGIIVTIDGPAGAGKSSIARQVAGKLGFEFLDTGAFYRAVTLAAIQQRIEFEDTDALIQLVDAIDINVNGEVVTLNGQDVSKDIRNPTVTAAIVHIADVPEIRKKLNAIQRSFVANRNVVTEGRDQGTDVFPQADCKLYLTASIEERALRRQRQLQDQGRPMEREDILSALQKRDAEDASRPVGALRVADDAIQLDTDSLTSQEVLEKVIQLIETHVKLPTP